MALVSALALVILTGCSGHQASGGDTAAGLAGLPIKLMVITSLTGQITVRPEAGVGAQAAAAAINAAGGVRDPQGGPPRPLEVMVCDDRTNPNNAIDCAHQAVEAGVVAVVGAFSFTDGAYLPVLSKAGIPSVANYPISAIENSDPYSFPMSNWHIVNFAPSTIAKSLGLTKLINIGIDTPTMRAASPLIEDFSNGLGMSSETLYIPPNTKDFVPFAAQTADAPDAALRSAMNGTQASLLLQALASQGVEPNERVIIQPADVISPELLADGSFDGVYMFGSSLPATEMSNPGVRRYNEELDQYGDRKTPRNTIGIMAWAGTHIISQLLDQAPEITSAELVNQMRLAGEIRFEPIAPFDWSAPMVTDGALRGTHGYASKIAIARVVNGELKPVIDDFVRFDEVFRPNV